MIEDFLCDNELSFIYVSIKDCSICHGLLIKLRRLLYQYPNIHLGRIDAEEVKEVAGKFSILTAPIMILIIENKEFIREDRFARFEQLNCRLEKIYELYTQ